MDEYTSLVDAINVDVALLLAELDADGYDVYDEGDDA